MEHIETVIVGGGQAGLATSYYLTRYGHEHIILEQSNRAANSWRNRSWDSFTLVTPNWSFLLPGAEYSGDNPDGYMPGKDVIHTFEKYIERFHLPVKYNTQVTSIEPADHKGFVVRTNAKTFMANNVVMATGFFQTPKIPAFHVNIAKDIIKLHSSVYRNQDSLPPGAVLIVGSAQSGCQIADELRRSGRKVFMCVGTAGRVPRRYRGKDIIQWLETAGAFDMTPDQLPPGLSKFGGIPQLTGANGGYTINLHQFARNGITLLGHLRNASDKKITLAPDLYESLTKIDRFEAEILGMIDQYIEQNKLDAPAESVPQFRDGFEQPIIDELDLQKEGINTIIWAIGYNFDFSLVKIPVFDADGFPLQNKGVTKHKGLYFVGLPWMPGERSGFLAGMGESARYIASCITDVAVYS